LALLNVAAAERRRRRSVAGAAGDLTSLAVIPEDLLAGAMFVARAAGVLAGLPAVAQIVRALDSRLRLQALKADGDRLSPGDRIATVSGPMRGILTVERTALSWFLRTGIAGELFRFGVYR